MTAEQLRLPIEAQLLAQHPAVLRHGAGMTSTDLASFIESISDFAKSRVLDIGAQQYAAPEGGQRFEDQAPEELVQAFVEEIADAINYLAMLAIKVLAARR